MKKYTYKELLQISCNCIGNTMLDVMEMITCMISLIIVTVMYIAGFTCKGISYIIIEIHKTIKFLYSKLMAFAHAWPETKVKIKNFFIKIGHVIQSAWISTWGFLIMVEIKLVSLIAKIKKVFAKIKEKFIKAFEFRSEVINIPDYLMDEYNVAIEAEEYLALPILHE